LRLQEIQIQFSTPDFIKSFQSLGDYANQLEESKKKVEDELWYNITVEAHKEDIEEKDEIIKEKDDENALLRQELIERDKKEIEQERIIAAYQLIVSVQQPKSKVKGKEEHPGTLNPNITPSQIMRLCESLKGIFEASKEQTYKHDRNV
jgi:hypothetical protein